MNQKFQNALKMSPQPTPPIWFMRQAGRYHKHYQDLRAKNSFMQLCKNPQLAAQVALGPIEDFDFDVSILFSDLLFPLEALGMGLEYKDTGPELGFALNADSLPKLKKPSDAFPQLLFQGEAVRLTREQLPKTKSLIGFVGGPWTLYTYATEGSHKGGLKVSKSQTRNLYKGFTDLLVPLLIKNIQLQLDAGCEIVMLFDTAAGELSPAEYQKWVAPDLKILSEAFPNRLGYYNKVQTEHVQKLITHLPWAGLGYDHRFDLSQVLTSSRKGFVQGNFDQNLFFLPTSDYEQALEDYLQPLAKLTKEQRAGWVCGLGHGVLPQTPEQHVKHFVQRVREVIK